MPDGDADLELTRTRVQAHEYTAAAPARHANSSSRSSSRRRLVFFALAATWGFIVGAGGILAAMMAVGQDAYPSGWAIPGLLPALAVAIAGGLVLAAAYKESKRRARR